MIMIMPGASAAGGVSQGAATFNRLTLADAEKLQRESTLLSAVSPVVFTQAQAISGGRQLAHAHPRRLDRLSDDPRLAVEIRHLLQRTGRAQLVRKVAVLGATVAKNLFPGGDRSGSRSRFATCRSR